MFEGKWFYNTRKIWNLNSYKCGITVIPDIQNSKKKDYFHPCALFHKLVECVLYQTNVQINQQKRPHRIPEQGIQHKRCEGNFQYSCKGKPQLELCNGIRDQSAQIRNSDLLWTDIFGGEKNRLKSFEKFWFLEIFTRSLETKQRQLFKKRNIIKAHHRHSCELNSHKKIISECWFNQIKGLLGSSYTELNPHLCNRKIESKF